MSCAFLPYLPYCLAKSQKIKSQLDKGKVNYSLGILGFKNIRNFNKHEHFNIYLVTHISKTHSYLVATLLACELAVSCTEYIYNYYNYAQEQLSSNTSNPSDTRHPSEKSWQ